LSTVSPQPARNKLGLMLAVFLAVTLGTALAHPVFDLLDLQYFDRLMRLRARSPVWQLPYDGTIVHLDINNSTLTRLNRQQTTRLEHAAVIRNLHAMGVVLQMHDFIFVRRSPGAEDDALIAAIAEADQVLLGVAFQWAEDDRAPRDETPLAGTWQIQTASEPRDLRRGIHPLATHPEIAAAARGLGFLNLIPDRDGVFRRVPLIIRLNDGYFPSLVLQTACAYLGVAPAQIRLKPGQALVLKGARRPGAAASEDIAIPIDARGDMTVNYIGSWERMAHYNFADVLRATETPAKRQRWEQELGGRIVVASDVSTGSQDVGPVPTDLNFPLSGIHANALHTILSGAFVRQAGWETAALIDLALLCVLAIAAVPLRSAGFVTGVGLLAGAYWGTATVVFLSRSWIWPLSAPLLATAGAAVAVLTYNALGKARQNAEMRKLKEIAERELEIGREIQGGFFPETIPAPPGWEVAAHFKAARQVAGDFYDVFTLGDGRLGFVLADVCGKGVGAALFMALIRSLLRAQAVRKDDDRPSREILLTTISHTNDYLAETHARANMFATLFFGLLEPSDGRLQYINAGHEPPVLVSRDGAHRQLKPTGVALGMFPDLEYRVAEVVLAAGEMLFVYTDGVTDAQDTAANFFTRARMMTLLEAQRAAGAREVIRTLSETLYAHMAGRDQFDDVTMLCVRRQGVS
jgi:sigma-B regulation protein RsbU (phosphoserine phosphatase)